MITLRDLLISRGAIRPLAARLRARREETPTLRLDDRGRAAAAQDIEDYRADPDRYAQDRLRFDVDEWMFGVVAEEEYS